MNKVLSLLLIPSLLALGACVPQEQADTKMARGCEAGVAALIAPKEIIEVKNKKYSDTYPKGEGKHRLITLTVLEKDGWVELDRDYSCVFLEQWGLFKMTHDALLIQIDIDGEVTGKVDGRIQGGFNEFLALTKTVDRAMGQ